MPPCEVHVTTVNESNAERVISEQFLAADPDEVARLKKDAGKVDFAPGIVWRNIGLFVILHSGALIGLYYLFFGASKGTVIWTFTCHLLGGLGITAGAHRLWAHRSYKATTTLETILVFFNCMAFQNDIIEWSRDHRCHHKWTDTDADPHNTNRGFFFAHMGWLLTRKHPRIREMGSKLDLSDLTSNKLLDFQRRYYLLLVALCCFLIPTAIPVYFWQEDVKIAFFCAAFFRYAFTLHNTWLINSAAHWFGYRPYDINNSSRENIWTTISSFGEGGHNYHHAFPQDYRTSEMPYMLNITRLIIDGFAKLGMAYDLRQVNPEIIQRQKDKQIQLLKEKCL